FLRHLQTCAYFTLYPSTSLFRSVGETTDGHHQIEMACGACHTSPFGGGELLQESCVSCHGAELKLANDAHPKSKFTDPRNADRLDRKSTRLNSSHVKISYAVFCL